MRERPSAFGLSPHTTKQPSFRKLPKLFKCLQRGVRACLETTRGAVFGEKAGWRDEGEYPWWIFD